MRPLSKHVTILNISTMYVQVQSGLLLGSPCRPCKRITVIQIRVKGNNVRNFK
jgi:hypothetical protein